MYLFRLAVVEELVDRCRPLSHVLPVLVVVVLLLLLLVMLLLGTRHRCLL